MKKDIKCTLLINESFCKCKHIKRSMWGFGPRHCAEYDGTVRICAYKELNVTEGGRFLVKFVEAEKDMFGRLSPNDFKSAKVSFPFENDNDTVMVNWDNGWSSRINKKYLKFKHLR